MPASEDPKKSNGHGESLRLSGSAPRSNPRSSPSRMRHQMASRSETTRSCLSPAGVIRSASHQVHDFIKYTNVFSQIGRGALEGRWELSRGVSEANPRNIGIN